MSAIAVSAFITVSPFWPRPGSGIGYAFGLLGLAAMSTQIAFHLHDRSQERNDISLRD